ncbi:MAG: TonB-dependent receptor, partial [candidate division Zixibacteria bacterium]|nr:TonB-dependent receptor [candidate division Zixibacteria bacterium]
MLTLKLKHAIIIGLFLTTPLLGATLSGVITDIETGEYVPGARIKVIDFDYVDVSDEQGGFELSGRAFEDGDWVELVITHIGYKTQKTGIVSNSQSKFEIVLTPIILQGQDIIVTAARAKKGETPAAFTNMTGKEIEQAFWAQDTPMLLTSMPNVFAYSDAGNGIGYSYLKIRGFDQRRISVMLNGIPLNDAESHEVYWIDLPDFANSLQDIQVQRGVGSSLYGASSIGGTINLITNDFSAIPELKVETGYGSYNSKKLSISGNSGLINDSYVFYGRYSRIETDGYRDNSWSKMYSYFIGIARYDENMTWKLNTYGGPEEAHLAYKGISGSQLTTNRKYNELEFDDEIDHFNQPHYELIHDWKINDNLNLANTVYYFHGEGYYNQFRSGKDMAEYNLGAFYDFNTWTMYTDADDRFPTEFYDNVDSLGNPQTDATGYYPLAETQTDLVRRKTVKEYDWGWNPTLKLKHNNGELTLGSEMRIHSGHHFGEVRWASIYPQDFDPNHRYYEYKGKSNTLTIYVHEAYRLFNKLRVMVNAQYQRHNYKLEDDKRYNVIFNRNYDYISPRAGFTYHYSENLNVFINASTASRQPAFKDIYDPTDFWQNPVYRSANFNPAIDGWEFNGKELNPEKLLDIELGADFKHASDQFTFNSEINLYRMQMKDELIPYAGQIDDDGYAVSGNAEKTLHQGIELSWNASIRNQITLNGNFSLNDDHFVDYIEYSWDGNPLDRSDQRIGGFPEMLTNYRLGYAINDFGFGVGGRYVGKQYIDNGEEFELDAYHILNADISYDFGRLVGFTSLKAILRVHNLADTEYEQAAYIEPDDGLPRYMV